AGSCIMKGGEAPAAAEYGPRTTDFMARYLIGIDLGTTNSALAYIDLQRKPAGRAKAPEIQSFAVPQLVAPGETAGRPLLPSFLYLPGRHHLPAGATALPLDPDPAYAVGELAPH